MKRLLLILLLAGCDSKNEPTLGSEAEGTAVPAAMPRSQIVQSAAGLQLLVDRAMARVLTDPQSARYSNLRRGDAGAICGEVDSRQKNGQYSGLRPFVVTPEGAAVVSTTPNIMFEDPIDAFPDFYISWCATPEELAKVGPRIPVEIPSANAAQELTALAEAKAEAEPPPAEPKPKALPPPQAEGPATKDEDSFFKAVRRPGEKAKTGD